MQNKKSANSWYVVHTKSRFENVVHNSLFKQEIEVFLPKVKVRSKRKDRRQIIKVPLFPGYIFVNANLYEKNKYLTILKTTGVVRLLGYKNGPVPINDSTIESLKIIVNVAQEVQKGTNFKKKELVSVVYGPFKGLQGYFERYKGKGRVIVYIETLGQFAAVEVDKEDIKAVSTTNFIST